MNKRPWRKPTWTNVASGDAIEVSAGQCQYYLVCCACGLVHRIVSKAKGTYVLRFYADNRRTGQIRRRRREAAIAAKRNMKR